MGFLAISAAKEKFLKDRMEALGIREEDLEESFFRSGGKGGQHLNKVSTCACLKHIPPKIEVKYQKERLQTLNRYHARVLLLAKINAIVRRTPLGSGLHF